jgi:hypothetical protein
LDNPLFAPNATVSSNLANVVVAPLTSIVFKDIMRCVEGREYKCGGYANAWGRCLYSAPASQITRKDWVISRELAKSSLKGFKFVKV